MVDVVVPLLESAQITAVDEDGNPVSLGSGSQGTGEQLLDATITLDPNATFNFVDVIDNETGFDDSDGGQRLIDPTQLGFDAGSNIDIEAEYQLTLEDGDGNQYQIIGVSVGPGFSNVIGFSFVDELPPLGVPLTVVANAEGPGRPSTGEVEYSQLVPVPCFTSGAMIETETGPRAIDTVVEGDRIATRDHGLQTVRLVARTTLSPERLATHPELRPIRVAAGAFGPGLPNRDMLVSPHHRLLLAGWRAEAMFGAAEVLGHACAMRNDSSITTDPAQGGVTYIHLLFDRHEIVCVDGVWSESFQPFAGAVDGLDDKVRDELFAIMPQLRVGDMGALAAPARRVLRGREVPLLRD